MQTARPVGPGPRRGPHGLRPDAGPRPRPRRTGMGGTGRRGPAGGGPGVSAAPRVAKMTVLLLLMLMKQ